MTPRAAIVAAFALLVLSLAGEPSRAEPGPRVLAYNTSMIIVRDEDGAPIAFRSTASLPSLPAPIVAWGDAGMVAIADVDGEWIYLRPADVRTSRPGSASCVLGPDRKPVCIDDPAGRGLPYCPGDPRCRKRKKPAG